MTSKINSAIIQIVIKAIKAPCRGTRLMKKIITAILVFAIIYSACSAAAIDGLGRVEGNRIWLATFDTADGWNYVGGAELELDTEDKTEGSACMVFATAVDYSYIYTDDIELDLSGYADGVLKFDLYIADVTALRTKGNMRTRQWVGFGNNPRTDDSVGAWALIENFTLVSGWNSIQISLSDADNFYRKNGFSFDKPIRYLRIVIGADKAGSVIKVDNLRIELPEAEGTTAPTQLTQPGNATESTSTVNESSSQSRGAAEPGNGVKAIISAAVLAAVFAAGYLLGAKVTKK